MTPVCCRANEGQRWLTGLSDVQNVDADDLEVDICMARFELLMDRRCVRGVIAIGIM